MQAKIMFRGIDPKTDKPCFTVGLDYSGTHVEQMCDVPTDTYYAYVGGDTLPVSFPASDPTQFEVVPPAAKSNAYPNEQTNPDYNSAGLFERLRGVAFYYFIAILYISRIETKSFKESRLLKNGSSALGEVTALKYSNRSRSTPSISYRFVIGQQTVDKTVAFIYLHGSCSVGDEIEIVFNPLDPGSSRPLVVFDFYELA